MARDPSDGSKRKRTPRKPPRQSFADAIGNPRFVPAPDGSVKLQDPSSLEQVAKRHAERPAPLDWVVSRQRTLRAAGFKQVVVDGVWGPLSQSAWQAYTHPRQPAPAAFAKTAVRPQSPAKKPAQAFDTLALLRRQAAHVHLDAGRAVNLVPETTRLALELSRRAVFPRERVGLSFDSENALHGARKNPIARDVAVARRAAASVRRKPIRDWKATDLLSVTVDPLTGKFDAGDSASVKTIQQWLVTHGHQVKITGEWDTPTHAALKTALLKFQHDELVQATHEVSRRYYSKGFLRPGAQPPSGFPLAHVPEPGELTRILQTDTFTARGLLHYLEQAAVVDVAARIGEDSAYVTWRDDFLRSEVNDRIGPFRPDFIPFSRHEIQMVAPNAALLYGAHSFDDLRARVQRLELDQERAFTEQRLQAQKGRGFWGSVLYGLSYPGNLARETVVADYHIFRDNSLGDIFHPSDDARARVRHEAFRQSKQDWETFRHDHFWVSLATEMIVDPLNLIPGKVLALPFQGVARGSQFLERAGYTLSAAGHIRGLPAPLAHAPLALAGPQLAARALADARAYHFAWLQHAATLSPAEHTLEQRIAVRGYTAAVHATQLKDTAFEAARRSVLAAERFGYARVPVLAAKAAAERTRSIYDDYEFTLTPDVADLNEQTAAEMARVVHLADPDFVDGLTRQRVSLYAGNNAANGEYSVVGHHIVAAVKEKMRVRAARSIARDRAAEYANLTVGEAHRFKKPWNQAFETSFKKTLDQLGSHFEGGADPDLNRLLKSRTTHLHQLLERVYLPALQDRLVQAAELAGEPLFDELGLWLGRLGDLQQILREFGLDAIRFGDTVKVANPLKGRFFDRFAAQELMEEEIDRRIGAFKFRAAVREAQGDPFTDDEIARQIEGIRQDVRKHWTNRPTGISQPRRWHDTRDFIEVPKLYAGHLDDPEFLSVASHFTPGSFNEGLLTGRAGNHEDDFTDRLAAWLQILPDDGLKSFTDPTRFDDGPGSRALTDQPLAEAEGAINAGLDVDRFQRALVMRLSALDAARGQALDQALRRQGLVLEALRRREGSLFSSISRGFSAATNHWKFATLALRPAWTVRNVADNTIKVLLQGVIDPRYWVQGAAEPGAAVRSVFEVGLRDLRETVAFFEKILGGDGRATAQFDNALDKFWDVESSIVSRVFADHGVPVPEGLIDQAKFLRTSRRGLDPGEGFLDLNPTNIPAILGHFTDRAWDLLGNRPEAYFRRVLYRHTYNQGLRSGLDEVDAGIAAWEKVDAVLFDYSKVSTIEDNLAVFAPFIQFWRKNTVFWLETFHNQPWFLADIGHFEQEMQDRHAALPEWMRRYASLREVSDAVARVPGLGWLVDYLADGNVMYDPMNFLSFSPMYRAFKQENPTLPADRAGVKFLSGFVDAMNDWGLGLNPFFRKPLELAGVLNYRAWQKVFPQTQIIDAFTRDRLHDRFPDGFDLEAALEDPILKLAGQATSTELERDGINTYVQMEITNQAARGEKPNRARAEKRIQDFLFAQSVVGFFTGAYVRRMTPEDLHLYQQTDHVFNGELDFRTLSARDQELYRLWRLRGVDRLQYDRYLNALPEMIAYHQIADFDAREDYKRQHPAIIPFVDPSWRGQRPSSSYVSTQALVADTAQFFEFQRFASATRLPRSMRKSMEGLFVTPELRDFWAANDTPRDIRDRMLQGFVWHHIDQLNDAYHSIPATDYDARFAFLTDNPILVHQWQSDYTASDDVDAILRAANADLRAGYFELIKASGWNAAASFLHQHPFIFEDTSAAGRVDPTTGEWIRTGHARTQHARDYLAAKPFLDAYFALPESERGAWLAKRGRAADIVRAYFDKYGHSRGAGALTQHARDYLAARKWLEHYFAIPKADRGAWLNSAAEGASVVLAYFKKYGKLAKLERRFKNFPGANDPEVNRRLKFWALFFSLTPDLRPEFVSKHAADYGVFVYGPIGEKERHAREQAFIRNALKHGFTEKAAVYLHAKPLLDVYFKLKSADDRSLFLRANPEVKDYLDRFAKKTLSGDKKLDRLIESYFQLPDGSDARSLFLREHPAVQDYFDEHSTPAERAIRNLLEVYFEKPAGQERDDFILAHPEVQLYFDKRKRERDLQTAQLRAFDESDPRLASFFDRADREIVRAGEEMARSLALRRVMHPATLERRTTRRPVPPGQ